MRSLFAYALSLVLALSGFVIAEARGASHDIGMDIVICSGVGMVTITIGPDGEPIEEKEVCPEGDSVFSTSPDLPQLAQPELNLAMQVYVEKGRHRASRAELSPSARGPPEVV